ncbi:hypothetical protein NWF32_28400 [Pseudomonas qingdaonensis]|nr:hypothetical protein [Pseudomonas qingdaonensis]
MEGGFPIGLGKHWVIEPQAQLINQQYYPGNDAQAQTLQAYDSQPSWTGRVGRSCRPATRCAACPSNPMCAPTCGTTSRTPTR